MRDNKEIETISLPDVMSQKYDGKFKSEIEKCRTEKQVYEVLEKFNRNVVRNNSDELGSFSIWISNTERIYRPWKSKTMKYQLWKKTKIEYSGISVFFGTDSYF